jgi:uncharacterized protein YjbI with pentapeptide repeats
MNKFIGAAAILACGICSGTVLAQDTTAGATSSPGPNAARVSATHRGPVLNGIVLNGLVLNGIVLNGRAGFDEAAQRGPVLQGMRLNGIVLNGLVLNGQVLQGTGTHGVALYGPLPQYLDPTAADASAPRSDWSAVRLDRVSVRLAQSAR